MTELINTFTKAVGAAVPLIAVTTADQTATMAALQETVSDASKNTGLSWTFICLDCVRGVTGLNSSGRSVAGKLKSNEDGGLSNIPGLQDLAPSELPDILRQIVSDCTSPAPVIPPGTMIFLLNAHRQVESTEISQSLGLLRNLLKMQIKTLVLLSPSLVLPQELEQDVLVLDDPLPDDIRLGAKLNTIYGGYIDDEKQFPPLTDEIRDRGVEAARGLSVFSAEQAFAVSLGPEGLDLDQLWRFKESTIEQTPGLQFYRGSETYDDIGGLDAAKTWFRRLFDGPCRPALIVFIDEIEKAMGGLAGDLSGVSQDQLGCMLRSMEDHGWQGKIAVGPPGAGKSMLAKATGNTFGVKTIAMDLGAIKGSLVGQSEQQMRQMLKVLYGIGGRDVFFIASCNKETALPPELKRRFGLGGIWYYDLPDVAEQRAIWNIQLAAFGLDPESPMPEDTVGWTGAEIRNCCRSAYALGMNIREAATGIIPVAKQDPAMIERLRQLASGKFLSASYAGPYQIDKIHDLEPSPVTRKFHPRS